MSTYLRLSAFYALVFGFIGVFLPWWPVWLAANGLEPRVIGALFAFGFVAKLAVNPLFAVVAGRVRERRTVPLLLTAASALVFLGFPFADSVVEVALLQALFLLLWVPLLPATEHVAIAETRGGGIDYGRVRMWGSISFILVSMAVGRLVDAGATAPIHAAGQVLLMLLVAGALWLPRGRAAPSRAGFPLRRLWGIPGLAAVFIAAGCVQASHAMIYSFGSIYWGSLGLDGGTIGLLWAEGVLVEIGLFLVAGRIRAHIGPGGMLLFAGAAATARWAAMPFLESVAAIAVIQALHGLSFGFAHLGVMEFVARSVAERLTAGAMALYSMLVMGLAMGVSALLSGFLFERFGGDAFLAMAAVAALGALLAATACRPEREN